MSDTTTTASVCRSETNKLTNLYDTITKCSSTDEQTRTKKIASNIIKVEDDLIWLRGNITNSFAMGSSMFGKFGHIDIVNQVQGRNTELSAKMEGLKKSINEKEKLIQRTERDFIDTSDTLPEKQPRNSLRVLEDYTMAFLFMSYLFMIIIFIYSYTITSAIISKGLTESLMASGILSMISFLILYYVC